MDEAEGSGIVLQSSFAHEPPEHRRFTLVLGGGMFVFFAGLSMFVVASTALGAPFGWLGATFLVLVLLAAAFGSLAIVLPKFVFTRTAALASGHLEYRDFWTTIRIPLANVLGAFHAVKDEMGVLLVFSQAGTAIGVGHGFREADKARLWAALRDLLAPAGVPVEEGLTETQVYARAKDLDATLRRGGPSGACEEKEQLRTRVLRALLIGSILVFMFGLVTWAYLGTLATGSVYASAFFGVLLVVSLVTISLAAGSVRLFATGILALGLVPTLFGAYLIFADLGNLDPRAQGSGGGGLGAFFLIIGIVVTLLGWGVGMPRRSQGEAHDTPPRQSSP